MAIFMGRISWKIIFVLLVLAIIIVSKYITISNMEESFTEQWSNIEYQYQRRSDLIPKFVRTVKSYAIHEKEVIESTIRAKASADRIKIDPADLTSENIGKYQVAQNALNAALTQLLDLSVVYPEMKADQDFLELQAQLEGIENRIIVEKRRFNEQVKLYNTYIVKFPTNWVASMFSIEKQVTFEADTGVENSSEVQF
jgi:LemA protein